MSNWKSIATRSAAGILFSLICLLPPSGVAQNDAQNKGGSGEIMVLQVRSNFHMIAGAGANIGVQVGPDGVVLVDAGRESSTVRVLEAVRKITDKPIRYIIDTNADPDHVGGNAALAKAGKTFFDVEGPRNEMARSMTNGGAAAVLAAEDVLKRMGGSYPADAWPTEAFFSPRKAIYLNREGIEALRAPAAHSDSDSFVFFHSSDVVMAGDVLDTTGFPKIDIAHGGSLRGEIDALNRLLEITIPPVPLIYHGGGTYVIPGHGRICDQGDLVEYRDMVVIVRDVVADMIKRGMTLDQIQAASPAKPYQGQYGKSAIGWTVKDFVEVVYQTLKTESTAAESARK